MNEPVQQSKEKTPKISIVTPSFNQGSFLERTIQSVVNQKYPNIEYIIMDGGSTDESVDIIRKYSAHISYWVSEKDKGQSDAIKKGFEMATGEIFAWLNSDDVYAPGVFWQIADAFLKENADVVYGNEILIDEKDRPIGYRPQLPFPKRLGKAFFINGGFWVYQPAAFWKASLYHKVGGVDPTIRFAMDNDLFVKFAVQNARFSYLNKDIVSFRYHQTSKTTTISNVGVEECEKIRLKYINVLPGILKSKMLVNNLGRFYLLKHLFTGNMKYIITRYLYRFAYRIGIKSAGARVF